MSRPYNRGAAPAPSHPIDVGDLVRRWRENPQADTALVEEWDRVRKGLARVPSFVIDAESSPRTLTIHRVGGARAATYRRWREIDEACGEKDPHLERMLAAGELLASEAARSTPAEVPFEPPK